jgi:hypothetical protein
MKRPRSRTPEPPYAWANKDACRRIRNGLDGDTLQGYSLAIYHALCEIASDKGSEKFQTLQSHIGLVAGGISIRTVQRCLPQLRDLGVISYETPKLKGPITFLLHSVDASDSRNDTPDGRNDTPSEKTGVWRTVEEPKKEHQKERRKKVAAAPVVFPPGIDTEDFKTAWSEWEQYRKDANLKNLPPVSVKAQLNHLEKMGEQDAIAAIRSSITQGWAGIFPPTSSPRPVREIENAIASEWADAF